MTVREAMNRLGLVAFPGQWNGRECSCHWQVGRKAYSATILRGKDVEAELLRRIRGGEIRVELDATGAPPEFEIDSFHAPTSSCAGKDDSPFPCVVRFARDGALAHTLPSKAGRKPAPWPEIVVLILQTMDAWGRQLVIERTAEHLTREIIFRLSKPEGAKVPHESKVQPYVSAVRTYWIEKEKIPKSI